MHRLNSAILAKLKNCQIGTFEPVHDIQFFLFEIVLLKHYDIINKKSFCNVIRSRLASFWLKQKLAVRSFEFS